MASTPSKTGVSGQVQLPGYILHGVNSFKDRDARPSLSFSMIGMVEVVTPFTGRESRPHRQGKQATNLPGAKKPPYPIWSNWRSTEGLAYDVYMYI